MTTLTDSIITSALETAGTMTQIAARNLQRGSGYGVDRYELACRLTDALGYDAFGKWRIDDHAVSRDRNYSLEARRDAAIRRDWRTQLSDAIARLDDADFLALIDRLADATVKAA